jgi:hypothetical protein
MDQEGAPIVYERNRYEKPFPCSECDKDCVFTRIWINKPLCKAKWLCYNCSVDYFDRDPNWTCASVKVQLKNSNE